MGFRFWAKASNLIFSLLILAAAVARVSPAAAMPEASPRNLDSRLMREVAVRAFPKWFGVMSRTWAFSPQAEGRCRELMQRHCGLDRWHGLLAELKGQDQATILRGVNRFVNRVPYRSDPSVWQRPDYWAAPGEFFARGGDCEDYAVAKYISLRILGFSPETLRLVVIDDTDRKISHAVLVVREDGRQRVLDNRVDRIADWEDLKDYRPIYAVNEDRAWLPQVGTRPSGQVAAP